MKKVTFLTVLFLMSLTFLCAQAISDYTYSTNTTGTLQDMTGATGMLTAATYHDDDASAVFNIGFNFKFGGVWYTQFSANSNGQMQLGATAISGGSASPSSGLARIAPLSGDNSIQTTGAVQYLVTGSAPNRKLIVEWLNLRVNYSNDTTGTYCRMQAWLYEGSNNIDFVYGTMWNMSTSAQSRGVYIATGTTAGAIGQILTINTTPAYSNTATSLTTTSFTASSALTNLDSAADGARRVFSFACPAATALPNPASAVFPVDAGWALAGSVFSWTPGATTGGAYVDSYDVYFGTSASPAFIQNQIFNTYTPTLAAGTTYYWKIVPRNTFGAAASCPTWSFKTPTATQVAESFENTTFPPAGWANPGTWSRSTYYYKHGTASAYKYGSTSSQYILSTPKVTITATSTFNLWTYCSSTTGTLQIVYSPDRTTWTQIGSDITHAAASTWYNTNVNLSSLAGNNYYLGVRTGLQAVSFYTDMCVGPEITPEAPGVPALSTPADAATNVNELPAFTWTAPTTGGAPTGYKLYVGTTNPPTTMVFDGNALTYTPTTPLTYGGTYYWTVAAYNGTGTSAQATIRSFVVRANPVISSYPYIAGNFENAGALPLNWVASEGVTGASYHWAPSTGTSSHGPAAPHGGTYFGWLYGYLASTTYNPYYLTTAPLNLGSDAKRLTYWYWIGTDTFTNPLFVEISTDNQATWTTLYTHANTSNTLAWYQNTISLAAYANTTAYIRFKGMSNYGSSMTDLGLDDIVVENIPAAPVLSLTPTAWDFGQTIINTAPTKQFTIANVGGGTLTFSSISISGTYFTLTSNPAPVSLTAGQSATFTVQYAPTAVGTHVGTVTLTDNRTVTTVDLDGTCYDPTISSFPWTENFDSVTVPNLPLGWSSIDNNADGDAWVTYASIYNSSPNCARIYTDYNTVNDDYLVTPPIVLTGNQRLKFYTRAHSTSEPDEISILLSTTTPTAAAFTNVLMPTTAVNYTTFTQYTVNLSAFSGRCFVSFTRKDAPADGWYLYLDDVLIEDIPSAPIFSYTPNTIDFGSVMNGIETGPRSVTITNTGAGTLNLAASDVSLTGTNASQFSYVSSNLPAALTAGQSVDIPIYVTGTTEGPISATLTFTYNAVTYNVALSATVMPAGVVVVGNGTSTQRQPFGIYFGYERSASIYTAAQLGTSGMLDQLWWYCSTTSTNAVPYKIYVGTTTDSALTATTWDTFVAGLTLVDQGSYTFSTAGWNNFVLDTPYTYAANNLIIAVETSYGGSGTAAYPYFYYSTGATGSHQYWAQDTTPPTGNGNVNALQPNLMLHFGEVINAAPAAPILGTPADGATSLPVAGFNLTWSPDLINGGIPDYYAVYMSQDEANIYSDIYFETTATSLNPTSYAGGPSSAITFHYDETYYWTVEAINGLGSSVVDPAHRFNIESDPTINAFPYLEDFETHADNSLPSGWTRSSLATGWQFGSDLSSSYWDIPTHTVYAAANDDAAGSSGDGSMDILTMPAIDLSGATPGAPILTFDSFYNAAYSQLANVEASTDGTTWTNICDVPSGDDWTAQTVSLVDYNGMNPVYLRFHADDNGAWASGWAIDNVSLIYTSVDIFAPVVDHYPTIGWPLLDTPIEITADVADNPVLSSGIASVTLYYTINAGTEISLPMTFNGTNYSAEIPGQVAGTTVAYYIVAVDAAPTPNTTTTATWDFQINVPVTLQYDSGTATTGLGLSSGTLGVMTGFANPFGEGNPIQINSVSAGMNNAGTANVHVFTYDSVNDVLVDVIPSFSQAFSAGVYQTIPLTNCVTTAGYFYVAFTDVVGPNYFSFDQTQTYYPGTHFLFFGAGYDLANLGTVESAGFPGSWLIRAEVQPGVTSLETPAVTTAVAPTGVELSWNTITGANGYIVQASADPYAADPWAQLAFITGTSYTYTGTDNLKFFKVLATSDSPTRSAIALNKENTTTHRPALKASRIHKASTLPNPKK